jgi:hypothetical protein
MGSIIAREGDQVVFEAFSSIPPLRTDALIKHATINAGSDMRLVTVAKVWGKLLIEGLPGSGKTSSLRALAAHWAKSPSAPYPLLVNLRRYVSLTQAEDLADTFSTFVRAAIPTELDANSRGAIEKLTRLAKQGKVAFLLDRLDECSLDKSRVCRRISELMEFVHPDCPIVVTSRPSGIPAATRLPLFRVSTEPPAYWEKQLVAVLGHIQEYSGTRVAWTTEDKIAWVESLMSSLREFARVPLFGVLSALAYGVSSSPPSKMSRGKVLTEVFSRAVSKWEGRVAGGFRYESKYLLEGLYSLCAGIFLGKTDKDSAE